jgi:hypothetical protein
MWRDRSSSPVTDRQVGIAGALVEKQTQTRRTAWAVARRFERRELGRKQADCSLQHATSVTKMAAGKAGSPTETEAVSRLVDNGITSTESDGRAARVRGSLASVRRDKLLCALSMITSQREMIRLRKGRLAWHRNNTTPGSPRPSQQPPQQTQQLSRHEASERPSIQASSIQRTDIPAPQSTREPKPQWKLRSATCSCRGSATDGTALRVR